MAAAAVLFTADLFVALTAIGGGLALAGGLERSRFSMDILRRTPFRSFLLPGLILVAVGASAAAAAAAILADRSAGGAASAAAGVLLAGFIAVEVAWLDDEPGVHWTEASYFTLGLLMLTLGTALALGA